MVFNGLIVIVFFIGFAKSKKVLIKKDTSSKLPLPFYKLGAWLVCYLLPKIKGKGRSRGENFCPSQEVAANLMTLHPTKRKNALLEEYYASKVALILLCLFIANLLSFFAGVSNATKPILIRNHLLERPAYGEGEAKQTLLLTIENLVNNKEVTFPIEEKNYTQKEADEILMKASERLDSLIIGKNPSLQEVREDLNLVSIIPGTICRVEWESEDYSILSGEGTLCADSVGEEGMILTLKATIYCQKYEKVREIPVHVYPKKRSAKEQAIKEVLETIARQGEEEATSDTLTLPVQYEGKKLFWSEKKNSTDILIFLGGVFLAVVLYIGKDSDLKKLVDKRNSDLMRDYPDIVSKMSLLLGAGMTIKAAWTKMVTDYQGKKKKNPKLFQYAYEEMTITYYELQSGIYELQAYENFGKRCRNQYYLKFSAIITQNLKRGSKGLSQMLYAEMSDAFEERKAYARRLGEEAGTKLMLPMFMMLAIVMIIIIIPAFLSFQL